MLQNMGLLLIQGAGSSPGEEKKEVIQLKSAIPQPTKILRCYSSIIADDNKSDTK